MKKNDYSLIPFFYETWKSKLCRTMRTTLFVILVTISQVFATGTYSQNARLSLNLKDVSIREVLLEIENKSKFYFMYDATKVDVSQKVDVSGENLLVTDILAKVFRETGITYEINNRQIALNSERTNMPIIQNITEVTGKVTDSSGVPLPGVTVVIQGTTRGTVTDGDGNYSLSDVPGDGTLVFSFVGMKSQEIPVAGKTTIDVVLAEDAIGIEEVVAIGYGTMKKSDITGSVASVSAEEIQRVPITRVEDAIQGRLSGVAIRNNNASPGNADISIRIRGMNSIQGNNAPLVVVDGLIGESLSALYPSDIQSIEVLKDASATAVYGSRGANGVILVTTKQGEKGKPKVTYNTFWSTQQVREKLDLMNAAEYAQTVNENREEFGRTTVFTSAQISDFQTNGGTDWQDEIFRDALWQNHELSISGGNETMSYYLSGAYEDRDGILVNTGFKRYSLRSNIKADLSKKLKFGMNLFLSKTENHPASVLNRYYNGGPTYAAQIVPPTLPVYDANGNYTLPAQGYGPPQAYNPLGLAKEPVIDNFSDRTSINTDFEYELLDGLKIKISGGYSLADSENNSYFNSVVRQSPGTETAAITDSKNMFLQNTNQVTYDKQMNDHHLIVTGVFEQQYTETNSNAISSMGFLTDVVSYNNLGLGDIPDIPSSERTSRSIESFVGRINYGFQGKYLVTATGRYDGASVFGANNKWGFFPSVALGWNMGNEAFMQNIPAISKLKLRASYGITGSQAVEPYSSLSLLVTGTDASYPINGTEELTSGVILGRLGNPDLKWEKTAQLDIGADISLFKGRIELTADYYEKVTEDLLLNVPMPLTSGSGSILRNVGSVGNKGVELYIGGFPVDNNTLKWESGFNISFNRNKVISLLDDQPINLGRPEGFPGFGSNTISLEIGQPMGLFKGYQTNGTWSTAEAEEAALYGAIPGQQKYIDQNNDTIINPQDIVIIGNAQPDFTFGWNNTFTYKNFDLNIFIQGVQGNDIYNISRVRMETSNTDSEVTLRTALNRWKPDNQDTDMPSFTAMLHPSYQTQSDRWLEDGSYIRLKTLTLGYQLPKSLLARMRISQARFYLSGTNLFTITNYSGYEPEASASNVDRFAGVDLATYPSQKTYTVGLNITF